MCGAKPLLPHMLHGMMHRTTASFNLYLIHVLIYLFIYLLIHSFIYLFIYSFIHSFTYSLLNYFQQL